MRIEPVAIQTDTTPLDGLLYLPGEDPPRGVVQIMHGNTMNFYVGPPRFLPPTLVRAGFACLSYNRRGHDVLSNRSSRELEGGAYQTMSEAVADNVIAGHWLRERGFSAPIVLGHSNGGTLAVRHVADHPDTPALILLSAHRGGSEMMRVASRHGLLAGEHFEEITARALDLVAGGRAGELLLMPGWWYVISAGTYVEFLTRCPDLLQLASRIRCPTLYLVGRDEPADLYPATRFAQQAGAPVDVEEVDCGHYYVGVEERVADMVTAWMVRHT